MKENNKGNAYAIVPTLSVRNGVAAIAFYQKAFGAEILMSHIDDDDGSAVAELSVNGARFVVADEAPEYDNQSPETLGGSPVRIGLQVSDPDSVAAQAIAAGATEIYAVADQDYGYRLGRIKDPYGHHWEIFKPLA